MSPAGNLDWLYYLLGYTLAAAGVLVLLWALFWDRSRGRRRCPKCWYDMRGVPALKCPECGVSATSERGLLRTRRHWRIGCAGFLFAYLALATARLTHESWTAYVPTTALLAGARWLPGESSPSLGPEFGTNSDSSLCGWSTRVLQHRLAAAPTWQRQLARTVALARIDSELDSYPPRISSPGAVDLLEYCLGGQRPHDDTRLHPLVAVELTGPSRTPIGAPLCLRVDVAGLGAADVIVDLQPSWPGAQPARVYGKTPRGSLIAALSDLHTPVPMVALGRPTKSADGVDVTATFRRRMEPIKSGEVDSLPIVCVRRFHVLVRIAEAEATPLQAAAVPWPLRRWTASDDLVMAEDWYDPGRWDLLASTMDIDAPADVTYAARVEVTCNGSAYFRGEWCWWQGLERTSFPWGGSPFLAPICLTCRLTPVQPLRGRPSDMGAWTAHLVSDPNVARWNVNATRFWSGEIEIPVRLQPAER
jgi:hypothetical protein